MLDIIDKISFLEKNAFCETNYFEIDISSDKPLLKLIDSSLRETLNDPIITAIERELLTDFLKNLFRIIANWDSNYVGDNLSEKSEWELVIQYKNNSLEKYYGENSYPINFDQIQDLKYKLIESIKGSIL